jgi:hypothetical protein
LASTSEQSTWRQWITRISKFLSHGFVLLVSGAILSSLLIPSFTRQWQDYQRELDIKSNLLSQMNQTAITIITELEAIQVGEFSNQAQEFNHFIDTANTWKIQASVIQSQLDVYYPQSQVSGDWAKFSNLMFFFYHLNLDRDGTQRGYDIQIIQEELSSLHMGTCSANECINWNNLHDQYAPLKNGAGLLIATGNDWAVLDALVKKAMIKIVHELIDSPITGYS